MGLILQELFTGLPPFDDGLDSVELLQRAAAAESRPVHGLPADLTRLITRLKSPTAGARPWSVDRLAQLRWIIDRPRRWKKRAAETFFQRALAIRESKLGASHPEVIATLEAYAGLLRQTGRPAEAEELVSRASAGRAASDGASGGD